MWYEDSDKLSVRKKYVEDFNAIQQTFMELYYVTYIK